MADKTYYIDREAAGANREINEHVPKCDYQNERRAEKFYLFDELCKDLNGGLV